MCLSLCTCYFMTNQKLMSLILAVYSTAIKNFKIPQLNFCAIQYYEQYTQASIYKNGHIATYTVNNKS